VNRFKQLQEVINVLNDGVGISILALVLLVIPYVASLLLSTFTPIHAERFSEYTFLLFVATFFYMSASANWKVRPQI
jgi:hypothetical protein